MINPVPNRGGPERAVGTKLYGQGFSDKMFSSASAKMNYFHNDTHMGQNPSNYNINVWKQHPEGVADSSELHVGTFARAVPGKNEAGESGIHLYSQDKGGLAGFMPDSSVHDVTWTPRNPD
jgi:hypothetical protein